MLKGKLYFILLYLIFRFRDVSLYNPINMAILEKEGCAAKDLKEANKVKRFSIRHQIEKHHHLMEYAHENRKKDILDNTYSYKRYNVNEDRGYDIINMERINKTQRENSKLKHNISEWDTICKNSNGGLKANYTSYNDGMKHVRNVSNISNKGKLFKICIKNYNIIYHMSYIICHISYWFFYKFFINFI